MQFGAIKKKHWRRSSRPEVFCKKGVLNNFAKFTGKHLCQRFSFNKVAGCGTCFPVNFAKFLKTPFLKNTSGGCLSFWLSEGQSDAVKSM